MLRHALEHRPDAIAQRLAALADAAATRGD